MPLRENMLMGARDEGHLSAATRDAVFERDIDAFERGLDTLVGVRGTKVSGGQLQRAAAARAFVRRVGRAIAKPVTGGALTTPVARGQNFDAIGAAPVLLQQRVDGDDVRLYLLEGRVLSCRAVVLPEGPVLDFRGSAAYQGGQASIQAVQVPQ